MSTMTIHSVALDRKPYHSIEKRRIYQWTTGA